MGELWDFFVAHAETIAALATVFGVLPTFIIFVWNQAALKREAMLARYDAVSRSYIDYQQLCLEHPLLQTSWYQLPAGDDVPPLSAADRLKKDILFDILTSVFERAHITYRLAPKDIRRSQWPGWDAFIAHFAQRLDYRSYWAENVADYADRSIRDGHSQYDRAFEKFMMEKLRTKQ